MELPPEDPDYGKGFCGRLNVYMYGTRKAADGWHCEYNDSFREIDFDTGKSSACVFVHKTKCIPTSVHSDDFTTVGRKKDLDWFKATLSQKYELKETARLGPDPSDDKEVRILNRIVRWTDESIEYEADPRHAEKLVQELGLEGCIKKLTEHCAPSVAAPGSA